MKRLSFLAMFVAMVLSASAQYKMHLWIDGVKISYPVLNLDSITFTDEAIEEPEEPTEPFVGVFSVSPTKYVTFSPGNLQYTQSTNTWSFAENQYDYIGTDNVTGGSVSSDQYSDSKEGNALADKIDLFGWSTSANNFGVSTSESDSDYSGSFVDWGTNTISNDAPNTWRTLTYDEWEYLRSGRPNASSLRGVAQVNGVNGLIFLPDNWTCPEGVTFKSGSHSDYSYGQYQTFTAEQWSTLEKSGAVFLPAAGARYGSDVSDVRYNGFYWSATEYDSNRAYCLAFYSHGAYVYSCNRRNGLSVRLVKDVEGETTEPEIPEEDEEPETPTAGIGVFSVGEGKTVTFSPGNLQYHPKNDIWRFAENQWDCVGEANNNIAADYDGWLDLFGWGTGDCPTKAIGEQNKYQIFIDWGTNKIGNDAPNTWRTLTYDEWNYLLNIRNNANSLHGVAQVNGVNGLIFLPDNWVCPADVTFKSGFHSEPDGDYYAQHQTFTPKQWSKLEASGAVFLPTVGHRFISYTYFVHSVGYYWSTTEYDDDSAYYFSFSDNEASVNKFSRDCGLSVRLAKDIEGETAEPEQPNPETPEEPEEPETPTAGIGVFSVGEGKTVTFSPGNLQYHPANDEWRFAENQWNYVGEANSNIAADYDGWLDLFGWGTGDCPTKASEDYTDYPTFVDWGTNKIGNDAPNTWRTLTMEEFQYIEYTRKNASDLMGIAQVNGVNGVIILPDNWVCPVGITFKSGFHTEESSEAYALYQTFDSEQWSRMEALGAVFIPASGWRKGKNVGGVESCGCWWHSTSVIGNQGVLCTGGISIYSTGVVELCSTRAEAAYSVRLVKDVEGETTEPETPEIPIPNPDIVNGVGVFSVSASRTVTFSPGNLQYHPKNDVWRFAEHQSISLDSANLNIAPDYDGWLDLFGWSGSTGPAYGVSSSLGDIYTGYFVDWGTNVIGNHAPNTWRTLSIYEWEYILFERDNASSLHFGAIVNGKHGRVLLPDNWEEIKPSNLELKDEYTINQWAKLEILGAVFLPAGGDRTGDFQLMNYQNWGSYWTSTIESYDCNWAYEVSVSSYSIILNYSTHILRRTGLSVRLVKDIVNPDISENGHEYVDLGLSVKWATCNIGANSPEEYGDYFAWGETEPKDYYDWSTYKWCNGSYYTQTKYCTNSSYGTVDNKTTLDLSDDAARANWGGNWRMPTKAEQDELREQCIWSWTTQNGVNGYKVTSKKNGNSIFLPAAGYRYDSSLDYAGSDGYYWSSSLGADDPNNAYDLDFLSDYVGWSNNDRCIGFTVRPVCQ